MKTKTDLYTKIVLTVIALTLTLNLIKDINFVSKAQAGEVVNLNVDESTINHQQTNEDNSIYCYAKNKYWAYYNGVKIDGADADSFKALAKGYAVDKRAFYYYGEKIDTSNYNSYEFKLLKGDYVKMGISVFYKGIKLEYPDVKNFIILREINLERSDDGF